MKGNEWDGMGNGGIFSKDEEMEREAKKEEICVDQVSVTWRQDVLKSLF